MIVPIMNFDQLALVDSIMAFAIALLRFPVAGLGCMTVLDYIKFVWCTVLFGVIFISSSIPIPGFPLLKGISIMGFGLPMIYLAAVCIAAGVVELRLNFVTPFEISGRKDEYVVSPKF